MGTNLNSVAAADQCDMLPYSALITHSAVTQQCRGSGLNCKKLPSFIFNALSSCRYIEDVGPSSLPRAGGGAAHAAKSTFPRT